MQSNLGEFPIVVGKAIKEPEYKRVGSKDSPVCSFCLNVGKRKDTTTIFVNCKAWYKWAEYAKSMEKGDDVIVIGHKEEREYNGKTYTDLVVEWMDFKENVETSAEIAPSGKPYPATVKFEETPGDGDLPF